MTLKLLKDVIPFPTPPGQPGTAEYRNGVLDADGEYQGLAFQISAVDDGKVADIIGWRTRTVTTAGDVTVGFQSVSTSTGFADGTFKGGGSPNSVVVAVAADDDNTWFDSTLDNTYTVTGGEMLCVILKRVTGTFVGNVANVRRLYAAGDIPYKVFDISSGDTKGSSLGGTEVTLFYIHFTDGTYAYLPGMQNPYDGLAVENWNTSSGEERGNLFQYPFTFQCCGCWIYGGGLGVDANYTMRLYAGGTIPGGTRLTEREFEDNQSASDLDRNLGAKFLLLLLGS